MSCWQLKAMQNADDAGGMSGPRGAADGLAWWGVDATIASGLISIATAKVNNQCCLTRQPEVVWLVFLWRCLQDRKDETTTATDSSTDLQWQWRHQRLPRWFAPGALALRAAHEGALSGRCPEPATRCERRHWRCNRLTSQRLFRGPPQARGPYTTFPHSVTLGH